MAPTPAQTVPCTPKELELMAKLKSAEEDRAKFVEIVRSKVKKLELELEASMECGKIILVQPNIVNRMIFIRLNVKRACV